MVIPGLDDKNLNMQCEKYVLLKLNSAEGQTTQQLISDTITTSITDKTAINFSENRSVLYRITYHIVPIAMYLITSSLARLTN